MNYIPYKTKFLREKYTSNSTLDAYLINLGFTKEVIELLINSPEENDFHLLHDLVKMVKELKTLDKDKDIITIVGDYDCDGATSTSILYLVLTAAGFTVNYHIPHRIDDGYGLSTSIVDKISTRFPDTAIIMTCDNGIAAVDAVKYAKDKGYKVFVTDHHTLDMDNLPEADYIVHPALPGYPFAGISGGSVAYKVAQGIMEEFGIEDKELSEYLLQLAAISVVSDVMPVANKDIETMRVNENRTILKKGIELMRTNPNWRLKVMFDMFKIQHETLDETVIGFYVSPVINAVGRLDDAAEAVAFLTADTEDKAILKCSIMGYLNEERKELKKESLNKINETLDTSKPAIIVQSDDIHEGIVGIIAGNLCDQNQKPAIVFTKCDTLEEPAWKASARSVEGVNLYEILKEINDENPDVIYTFGGHSGAAGLTVLDSHMEEFTNIFNDKVAALGDIETDKYYMTVLASDIDKVAKALEEIKPLGNGLPKPIIKSTMFINQYDFFYSSGHVKLSNCFKNELWLYNALEEFTASSANMTDFEKTMDNTEKKMSTYNISRREAKKTRWERWESKKNVKPLFDCIFELDYGNFMGSVGPIYSVIQYNRK